MPVELTFEQRNLADVLWDSGAFKVGQFRLKLHERYPDEPLSPYYISMREKDVKPGTYPLIVEASAAAIRQDSLSRLNETDVVCGIPKAGDPIAAAIARTTGMWQVFIDKIDSAEQRQIGREMTGRFEYGWRVLGVDDLITAADTKLEFIAGLKANNLVLGHLGVAVDREQGGMQKLHEAGVSASAALRITGMLDYYLGDNRINSGTYDEIRTYIET